MMGTMASARINTTQGMVLYRDFIIQEAYDPKSRANVWEWTHDDFGHPGKPNCEVTGDCQTMFECIDAVDAWHQQSSLEAPQES